MVAIGFIVMWGCVIALLIMEIKRCNRILKNNKNFKSEKDGKTLF